LAAPRTLLATGNLLFEAGDAEVAELEQRLETALEAQLGKAIPIIVRSAGDWLRLVKGNPFMEESAADGSRVVVRVQRDRLGPAAVDLLEPYRTEEKLAVIDGDLWASFPVQISTTRLAGALTPKRLGIGTMRNWNTVRRIAEAVRAG
jgi:uncharacterized protein (DUF1697 family)